MATLFDLIDEISKHLKNNHWQLVTAESCTGGLIASELTEIPGSSLWFERGFITYSNLAKEQMLGVSSELLNQYGAVSEEVARAMAIGALNYSAGHIALSVTGIAGPDGGSREKPVGTVCFGWAIRDGISFSAKRLYTGNRHDIRQASCLKALKGILAFFEGALK